jgi:hypothetical protein
MNKKLISIIIAISVLLVAGFGGYNFWWKKTPQYSLQQVATSIQSHDLELFKKHVDLDSLLNRFMDDAFEQAKKENEKKKTNAFEAMGQQLGEGLIQLFKPRLVEMLKLQIEKYVETGTIEKAAKGKSEPPLSVEQIKEKLGDNFRGIKDVRTEGKISVVDIELFDKDKNQTRIIGLKMREKEGGYWQLIEIANFSDFLKEEKGNESKTVNKK